MPVVAFVPAGFAATTFFLVVPVAVFAAGLVAGLAVLDAGFEFCVQNRNASDNIHRTIIRTSLDAPAFAFGASLTFPEGPLGRANTPFSAPVVIARFS